MLSAVPFPVKDTWNHEFCCVPLKKQNTTPSAAQADQLKKAGLGKKKIVFENKNWKHDKFVMEMEKHYPQLKRCGGFTLHRAKTGGQGRPMTLLLTRWYNLKDLWEEVTGHACLYIQPIQ